MDFRVLPHEAGSTRLVVFVQILVEKVEQVGVHVVGWVLGPGVEVRLGPRVVIVGVGIRKGWDVVGVGAILFGLVVGKRKHSKRDVRRESGGVKTEEGPGIATSFNESSVDHELQVGQKRTASRRSPIRALSSWSAKGRSFFSRPAICIHRSVTLVRSDVARGGQGLRLDLTHLLRRSLRGRM